MAEEAIVAKIGENIQRKEKAYIRCSQYLISSNITYEIKTETRKYIKIGIKIEVIIGNLSII